MDLDRLTEKAQEAVRQGQALARRHGHPQIEPEHIALTLLSQDGSVAARIVEKAGAKPQAITSRLEESLGRLPRVSGAPAGPGQVYVAPRVNEAFGKAEDEAQRMEDEYVSVEHLLLALADLRDGPVADAFRSAALPRDKPLEATAAVRGGQRVTTPPPEGTYEPLERYGRDLTALAQQGKLDPVIGRDEEIRRVIQILSRRTKNNPVLIGPPGVGKTAIVEGLVASELGALLDFGAPPRALRITVRELVVGRLERGALGAREVGDAAEAAVRAACRLVRERGASDDLVEIVCVAALEAVRGHGGESARFIDHAAYSVFAALDQLSEDWSEEPTWSWVARRLPRE